MLVTLLGSLQMQKQARKPRFATELPGKAWLLWTLSTTRSNSHELQLWMFMPTDGNTRPFQLAHTYLSLFQQLMLWELRLEPAVHLVGLIQLPFCLEVHALEKAVQKLRLMNVCCQKNYIPHPLPPSSKSIILKRPRVRCTVAWALVIFMQHVICQYRRSCLSTHGNRSET